MAAPQLVPFNRPIPREFILNTTMLAELINNKSRILENLNDRKADLEIYDYLQRSLQCTNVSTDKQYQSKFRKFYRIRRDKYWQEIFFSILEQEKNNCTITFAEILKKLHSDARHNGKRQIEASFSSKLVATIRSELPVYDSRVRKNLGLQTPPHSMNAQRRICRFICMYSNLRKETLKMTKHKAFAKLRTCFDTAFPGYRHFTDVKKLDLFLWQYR